MVDVRVTRGALHHQTITSGDSGEGGGLGAIHLPALLPIPHHHQLPNHASSAYSGHSTTNDTTLTNS